MDWLQTVADMPLKYRIPIAVFFFLCGVPFLFSPMPTTAVWPIILGGVVLVVPAIVNAFFTEAVDSKPLETTAVQRSFATSIRDEDLEIWLSDFGSLFPEVISDDKVADMVRLSRFNPRHQVRRFNYAVNAYGVVGSLAIIVEKQGESDYQITVRADEEIYEMLPVDGLTSDTPSKK